MDLLLPCRAVPRWTNPQLQCLAAAAARAPWAGKVTKNERPAWAQRGNPQRPPQELHCTLLPGLVAGQATNRAPSCRNTAGASGGSTQTAGMPCRCISAATERDSVEALTTSPRAAACRSVA